MKINKKMEEIMRKKYYEMKTNDINEDYLREDVFGRLMVFINKKPKYSLFSIKIDSDELYFGSETI